MNDRLEHVVHETDFCVVGGGMAGLAAAVSAARAGIRVVLMQDRPVLGGNASGEIRMWICGALGTDNRETGLLSEIELENIRRNPENNYSVWDAILYDLARKEKNLTLLMNCSCADAAMKDGRIESVSGWQLTTYTWHTVRARYFADCSGDSILAPLTGARYRIGREGADEFGEDIAPEKPDARTMGMTCLLQARQRDREVPFTPPVWARHFASQADLPDRPLDIMGDSTFWWIELGGEKDSIRDTEEIKDELLAILFGVWDYVKNRSGQPVRNFEIEWIGFLPGKRESRRYVAPAVLTQNDVRNTREYPDTVAYGGWSMDDHNPAGIFSGAKPPTIYHSAPSPYPIPFGCLYSVNVENLFFAGRNISATHTAMSSTRVMGTCALLGEAVGSAAAVCIERRITPDTLRTREIARLQQLLQDNGCWLPPLRRTVPELSRRARLNLPEADRAILFNGMERPRGTEKNSISLTDAPLIFAFGQPEKLTGLRIFFDIDFPRETVSSYWRHRRFAMSRCHYFRDEERLKVPATLVKEFRVTYLDSENVEREIFHDSENYQGLRKIPLGVTTRELRIYLKSTWGAPEKRIFACDLF